MKEHHRIQPSLREQLQFLLLGPRDVLLYLICLSYQTLLVILPGIASATIPASPSTNAHAALARPGRLETHVRRLALEFAPRDYEHLDGLNRAADYIAKELRVAGGSVSEQLFTTEEWNQKNQKVQRGPFRNIIAAFGPETKKVVVVGAHYDAYGSYPGADDNASGVAGLLELARLLGVHPPAMKTLLVAYTLEEPPFFGTPEMGSFRHAQELRISGVLVKGMICLEMIGHFSDAPRSQSYPSPLLKLFYPSKGRFIAVVGRFKDRSLTRRVARAMREVSGLSVESLNAPDWLPGVDFSDHRNYWSQGYQAVMVTDTAFYRNPRYHTTLDRPETLDFNRMALVVDGVFNAVQALGNEQRDGKVLWKRKWGRDDD